MLMTLLPHTSTPCAAVHALQVSIIRSSKADWQLQYTLQGNLNRLRLPALTPSHAADGLWEHTCFEAFIGAQGNSHYHEFNFAPSTAWAAYAFRDYRQRVAWDVPIAPVIIRQQTTQQLTVTVLLADALLPACTKGKALQVGLTAVIEAADGNKSYWALHHPSERPDFHHRDGLIYEIWP